MNRASGILAVDLCQDRADRQVGRRKDQLAGEGDGERCGDLLHGIDRVPDGEPLFLDLRVGGERVIVAVGKNSTCGRWSGACGTMAG